MRATTTDARLVAGPSARSVMLLRQSVALVYVTMSLALGVLNVFDPSVFDATGLIWVVAELGVLVLFVACAVYEHVVRKREAALGYTTCVNGRQDLELRDPRTGETLRAAGSRLPGAFVSVRRARKWARSHGDLHGEASDQIPAESQDPFKYLGL